MTRSEGRLLYELICGGIDNIAERSLLWEYDSFFEFVSEVKKLIYRELCPRITDEQLEAVVKAVKEAYKED